MIALAPTDMGAVPYYQHVGYSMVDHQLDPLLEVIRSWSYDQWAPAGGVPTGAPDLYNGRGRWSVRRLGWSASLLAASRCAGYCRAG